MKGGREAPHVKESQFKGDRELMELALDVWQSLAPPQGTYAKSLMEIHDEFRAMRLLLSPDRAEPLDLEDDEDEIDTEHGLLPKGSNK